MAKRGCLFVFEGLDRAGKSTQAGMLSTYLIETRQSRAERDSRIKFVQEKARAIKFPDRESQTGRIIDQYLAQGLDVDDNAVHLLFSANRWEKRDEMEALLRRGVHLVVDRYAYSGVAYSAAKGRPRLSREWCAAVDRGLIAPDAVFFLRVTAENAQGREDYGAERYEKVELQRRVAAEFAALQDASFHVVDAGGTKAEVHARVRDIAARVLAERDAGELPLRELWADGLPGADGAPESPGQENVG